MKNTLTLTLITMLLLGCTAKKNVASVERGGITTLYETPCLIDHSIVYNDIDKKWHLFGIINPSTSFIHLTADSLTQQGWVRENEDFADGGKDIWAPHIINHDGLFYMFYTKIGVPREICLATSKDLYEWEYREEPVMAFKSADSPNLKNKDPMVFRDDKNDQWIMYYSMMKDAKNWVVGYSTSPDLHEWSDYNICFDENTTSPSVESPFVIKQGDDYLLFLSARPWPYGAEEVFVSKTPYHWDSTNLVKRFDPWHAAEIIQDHDGRWYMTHSTSQKEPNLRIAPLMIDMR